MKKKIVFGLLISLMSISVLAGCGEKPEKISPEQEQNIVEDEESIDEAVKESEADENIINTDEKEVKDDITEDNDEQETEEIPAICYYDRVSYEEEGFFYFIVLRDNGDAYLSMQDGDFGTWEDGVIHLKNWVILLC